MTTLWRRPPKDRSESGMSLMELVVVLALTAVVLPTAYGMVTSAQQTESITTNRFAALGSAQIIMDRISKDLRAGVGVIDTNLSPVPTQPQVFLSAGPRDIVFYSALADPNGPTKLHAYTPAIAGTSYNAFNEDSIAPNSGGANPNYSFGTTWGIRIDGRYVSPSGPVFTYYNKAGTRLDDGVHALAASAMPTIDTVGINLTTTVNPNATAVNPLTTVTAMVHVRSVDYNPNGG